MLSEFQRQLFQLPLIATCWPCVRDRYVQEKRNLSFPLRFILSMIEQTIVLFYHNIVQVYAPKLNYIDQYLCSHMDTIRMICPIINQSKDELINRFSQSAVSSFLQTKSSSSSNDSYLMKFFQRYLSFLTHLLMIVEIYCKYILNELNDHIDSSRNLWKNLNMADGRSLEQVESYSEKLLVLGRRMTGNSRQFIYLIRYQFKRTRHILFSFLRVPNRLHRFLCHLIPLNYLLNDRLRYYLDILSRYALDHPWMKWMAPEKKRPHLSEFPRSTKLIRPMFFVPSNNTSDCSGTEDSISEIYSKVFQSTPYRRVTKQSPLIHSKTMIDHDVSNISSSSSDTLEQSLDVKDIVRQVECRSPETSESSHESIDEAEENRFIERVLNETNDQPTIFEQPAASIFDLSPMLASGCAV